MATAPSSPSALKHWLHLVFFPNVDGAHNFSWPFINFSGYSSLLPQDLKKTSFHLDLWVIGKIRSVSLLLVPPSSARLALGNTISFFCGLTLGLSRYRINCLNDIIINVIVYDRALTVTVCWLWGVWGKVSPFHSTSPNNLGSVCSCQSYLRTLIKKKSPEFSREAAAWVSTFLQTRLEAFRIVEMHFKLRCCRVRLMIVIVLITFDRGEQLLHLWGEISTALWIVM